LLELHHATTDITAQLSINTELVATQLECIKALLCSQDDGCVVTFIQFTAIGPTPGTNNLKRGLENDQERRDVARSPRDTAAVLFGLKFTDDIRYKFESSQASKARLQSSKRIGAKQNLTQNGDSRSFKVMCFGVSGKAIRH